MLSPQVSGPVTSAMSLTVTLGTQASWPHNGQQYKESPMCCQNCPSPGQVLEEQAPACPAPRGPSPRLMLEEEGNWGHVMSSQKQCGGQMWTRVVTSRAHRQSPARQGHRWDVNTHAEHIDTGPCTWQKSHTGPHPQGRPEAASA